MVPKLAQRLRCILPVGGLGPHRRWPATVGLAVLVALAVALAALRPPGPARADQPEQTAAAPAQVEPAAVQALATVNVPCGNVTDGAGGPWLAGNVYVVSCNVTVPAGSTLTVQPGAVIKFQGQFVSLIVQGTLLAQGTATAPIAFTSLNDDSFGGDTNNNGTLTGPGPGNWGRMEFAPGSRGRLAYAFVGYGGSNEVGNVLVKTLSGDVTLDNVTLQQSGGSGLYAQGASISVTNSRIISNTQVGLQYNGLDPSVPLTITDNTFSGGGSYAGSLNFAFAAPPRLTFQRNSGSQNATNGFQAGGTIGGPLVWDNTGSLPLVVNSSLTIAPTGTLTLAPGTVVKFQASQSMSLIVQGTLQAVGTADAPLAFTSLNDDEHGGDTNNNGTLTTPAPGNWGRIEFAPGSHGRLAYAFVGYGSSNEVGNVLVKALSSDVTLDHVTLQSAHGNGLYAQNASVSVTNSRIISNTAHGLYYNGLDSRVPLTVTDNTFGGVTSSSFAAGINFAGPTPSRITLQRNTANPSVANSRNGFSVVGTVDGSVLWDNTASLPLIVDGVLTVGPTATLTLTPGTVVKFSSQFMSLIVQGTLLAEGTAPAPMAFTSLNDDTYGGDTNNNGTASGPAPGNWGRIEFAPGSHGRLAYAFVGYGGSNEVGNVLVKALSDDVLLDHVTLQRSGGSGLHVENASPVIKNSTIISNSTLGVRNTTPTRLVDARFNWWGDASGPYNRSSNAGGKGSEVGDGVIYFPWIGDPSTGQRAALQVSGPGRVSPGQQVDYAISYANGPNETMQDAVVVLILPVAAEYLDSTGGGVYWPERHEVFWRLGNLAPEANGILSTRLRYNWGIPSGAEDTAVGLLIGSNVGQAGLAVEPYLSYTPRTIASTTALSSGELQAERTTYADLDKIYGEALAGGFTLGEASRLTLAAGEPVVQVVLFKGDTGAVMYLRRQGARVAASTFDRTSYAIRDATGGITQNLQLQTTEFWGSWATQTGGLQAQGLLSSAECFGNCVLENMPGWLVANKIKAIGAVLNAADCFDAVRLKDDPTAAAKCAGALAAIPGAGEAIDTLKCGKECSDNPDSHLCKSDKVTCDKSWWNIYYWLDVPQKKIIRCTNGRYSFLPEIVPCAFGDKCVEDVGCVTCGSSAALSAESNGITASDFCRALTAAGGACAKQKTQVRVARDPNAKYGPQGDLLPGQLLTYTITYENEGAGDAFGVFVVDPLSEFFDDSSLAIFSGGRLITASRTIVWQVGDLKPKGQAGSTGAISFTVKLKAGLPSGTIIMNQATVYFPSVPEETPTNPVVNVVQPLAAQPQTVETPAGQAVTLTLRGADASGTALTYAVVAEPLNGRLTGTVPALTYTPVANFVGQDRFTFKVSNGITESKAAEVTVAVNPSGNDTTAPQVRWSEPGNGVNLGKVSATPVLTDAGGPAYVPPVLIQFSEALSATTVTSATVRLVDGTGRTVKTTVAYDGSLSQVTIVPREPWRTGRHTVTVTTGVKDASGNALPANHTFSFDVEGSPATVQYNVYLPAATNKFGAGW